MDEKNRHRYFLNILIILAITFISLYFSIGKNYQEVFATLRQAQFFWILVMLIMMVGFYLFDSLSLFLFGRTFKKDYKYVQAFTNSMSNVFLSAVTPYSGGGQPAQLYVFNKQGINLSHSTGILLMSYICSQIALVVYTLIAIWLNLDYIMAHFAMALLVGLATLSNVVSTIGFIVVARSTRLQNFIVRHLIKLLGKLKFIKNSQEIAARIEKFFVDFREQLNFLIEHRRILFESCLCNFIKLIFLYSVPFFGLKALNLDVGWSMILTINCYCSFVYLISAYIPVPGASGGTEACYMLFFGFLGTVGASSSMTLWRFISYYVGLIFSGIFISLNKEISASSANKSNNNSDDIIANEQNVH